MLDFTGYKEQALPCRCPDCQTHLDFDNATGVGDFPNPKKPSEPKAIGYECPGCGVKSYFHDDGRFDKLYNWHQEEKKLKEKGSTDSTVVADDIAPGVE